jgi:D-glycero-alpha-D-manno-heptose-7-phosphate kinase
MIISRTPYRISLFGGGTDYPAWYSQHGGAVLAASIDKYCYLTCRRLPPFFEHTHRVVWSKIETCQEFGEIEHPAVRAILQEVQPGFGIEIHHVGDLPARSGMGSSSAFTVGLLHALQAIKGRMFSRHQLALEAIRFEQQVMKETVGSQDQVSAAYGGFNRIEFHSRGDITVTPITIPRSRIEELQDHLMLFYTGIQRTSSQVSDSYAKNLHAREKQLHLMRQLVDEAMAILNSEQDLRQLGTLLRTAWDAKRSLSDQVSSQQVDSLVDQALRAGALGGKLTGAGGGGFLLLVVEPELRSRVKAALSNLLHVPFRFEWSGSHILFAAQSEDYDDVERDRREQQLAPFQEWTPHLSP